MLGKRSCAEFIPPFTLVEMPLDNLGRGPASEKDCVEIRYDIWNAANQTVLSFDAKFLAEAEKFVKQLNKK